MVYRALRSFSGVISMAAGEERELKDQYLIDGLLKVGYIIVFFLKFLPFFV